jgi:membrane-bound ClpP family serine protease
MYDPNVKLVKGEFNQAGPGQPEQWVKAFRDADDPETQKLVAAKRFVGAGPVSGVPDGQLGSYPAALARDLGLIAGTAETRADVAERYNLPPTALRDDPLQGRSPSVYRWTLKGDVDKSMQESVNRVIRDVRRKGGNVLILTINCGGNDLTAARQLADDLMAAQHGEDGLHIVGFIPEAAPSAGTVVALGCTQIVMTKAKPDDAGEAKEAEIGDFSGFVNARGVKEAEVEAHRQSIRELAELQQYPPVLIDGMFKKDVEILRVRPKNNQVQNQRRLMTREAFENARADWDEDAVIKPKGQLLKLNATRAVELGLARSTVDGPNPRAVCAAYGWPEPQDPDPGWLDKFAEFLRQPVVTVLLVVLGFTGLILELKVPGLTVPGIIAALCFILVFWAQSRFSGQTFVLALLLFMLGLVLIGIEIFVLPGFGACGICGILCMLAGLGLVTLDKVPESGAEWGLLGVKVSQYMFAMMGALALAFFIARFLPKMPYANRLVLNAPVETPGGTELLPGAGAAAELLGAIGTTSTPLRPAGVVKFADKFVDVVSDGGFIPAGTRVQVIQVEGTRIVVKEV